MNGPSPSRHLRSADLLEREMALHRADPAALRQDDGDRLLLDHRRPVDVARRAQLPRSSVRRSSPNLSFSAARSRLQPRPLLAPGFRSAWRGRRAPWPAHRAPCRSPSPPAGASCRRRMLRIASAWRSVSANSAIITGLGSSSVRMISITRSRLRKAMRKPSSSSSRSSILPIRTWLRRSSTSTWKLEPRDQRLLQAHHARRAARIEHVEVEREADFEVGQPVQAFEQQVGIDGAARGSRTAAPARRSRPARRRGSAASCRRSAAAICSISLAFWTP